jgi:hypothetical protein
MAKCNLDLVAVQEVCWIEDGSQPVDAFTFVCGNENANHHLGVGGFSYIRESYH